MTTPIDPLAEVSPERVTAPSWTDAAAEAHGVVPLPENSAPATSGGPAWRADLPAAARLVKHTMSLGALAAGFIEYSGWQIAQRADASAVVPLGEWAIGLVRNLGGAAVVGLGVACITMLVPRFRKRPLRAASAAFAFGVAGFLGFLLFLVSLAF